MTEPLFRELVAIMARLRAEDGCPWDREQTMEDLGRYIREEADEVVAAVEEGDRDHIAEELGDLLFNILHAARIGEEEGTFTLDAVLRGVRDKIIRRHPHVFGDAKAETTKDVLAHWARVKGEEKQDRSK